VKADGSSTVKLVATQAIAAGEWVEIDYRTVSVDAPKQVLHYGAAAEQVLNYGFVDLQGPTSVKCKFNHKSIGQYHVCMHALTLSCSIDIHCSQGVRARAQYVPTHIDALHG
jgi:hypothetical protein